MRRDSPIQPTLAGATDDPVPSKRPGALVAGRYRLERIMARGGMGTVWIATNVVLESSVAIKVLHRSMLDRPEAAARLLTEARAAASVRHPNIIQVFDYGHFETGEPFIVMELLDGEDLADRIVAMKRLEPAYAVRIIAKVARALEAAHAKGIIHRDLKPDNVFLSVDESCGETPKVVDFGIAWLNSQQYKPRLTQAGRVVGSPAYLSPEQARADDVDCRTDIWSLCVTLYECLVGSTPFADESQARLLMKILAADPAPITRLGIGDERLWRIIEKGLRKDRNERWQSAEQLAAALESWLVIRASAVSRLIPATVEVPAVAESANERTIPPTASVTLPPQAIAPPRGRRLAAAVLMSLALLPLGVAAFLQATESQAVPAARHTAGQALSAEVHDQYTESAIAMAVPRLSEAATTQSASGVAPVTPVTSSSAAPRKLRQADAPRQPAGPQIPREPNF